MASTSLCAVSHESCHFSALRLGGSTNELHPIKKGIYTDRRQTNEEATLDLGIPLYEKGSNAQRKNISVNNTNLSYASDGEYWLPELMR